MSRGQMEGGDCGGHLVDVFERCIPRQRYQAAVDMGMGLTSGRRVCLCYPGPRTGPSPHPCPKVQWVCSMPWGSPLAYVLQN